VLVLFDQGTPAPLRHALAGHVVETAYERGWSSLKNGELIAAAESAGFEVFVTTDKNLKYLTCPPTSRASIKFVKSVNQENDGYEKSPTAHFICNVDFQPRSNAHELHD
jgi:hypothetical protein